MKKIIIILVLSSALLSACEGDPEIVPRTPTETKIQELMVGYDGKIDMAAFVADAQQGVWMIDEYDMIYTNGEVLNGQDLSGGAFLDNMMQRQRPIEEYAFPLQSPDRGRGKNGKFRPVCRPDDARTALL